MGIFSKLKTIGRVVLIEVDRLLPNPSQPRRHFDPDELRSLADSIAENGILQPLTVRESGEEGRYEIIAGERRYRAARLAGCDRVPCLILDADSEQAALFALMENLQRQDLGCFEEAEGIALLIDRFGLSQEEAARRLGKAQSTIANKLRLLRLSAGERERIEKAGLSERHARALLRIEDEELRGRLLDWIIERGLNVAETDQLIDMQLTPPELPAQPEHRGSRQLVVKDVRLFVNTINKAVDTMRRSGIEAVALVEEKEECLEYLVRIPRASLHRRPTPPGPASSERPPRG